jgi:predicted nucleic acid-binding Zn ribbon protein
VERRERPVTAPVTSLSVRVPIERVTGIQIVDSVVKVKIEDRRSALVRQLQHGVEPDDLGPFGRVLLNPENEERRAGLIKYGLFPNRRLPSSALDDFLAIASVQDLAAFTQKYGRLAPVDEIPLEFAVQQREKFSLLLWLTKAIADGNAEDVAESLRDAGKLGLDLSDNPHDVIAFHISKQLRAATLTMLPEPPQLQPVLMCSTVLTGLYALLLKSVIEELPYAVCSRCKAFFRANRPDKRFCSERCQQAEKQERYRQALAQKQATAKVKKGVRLHGRQRSRKD